MARRCVTVLSTSPSRVKESSSTLYVVATLPFLRRAKRSLNCRRSQIFPTYDPGFTGLQANKCITPCPLLMQTELTGLLSLCKLEVSSSFLILYLLDAR